MNELIFSGYGIEISRRDQRFFLSYDAGEIASVIKEEEISEEEARQAQESSASAYRIILKCQKRAESQG